MKKVFSALVFALACGSGFAGEPNLLKVETAGAIAPGSTGIYVIYNRMLRGMGFPNQAGHTMAAAVLAKCIGTRTVQDHLLDYNDMLKILSTSAITTIRCGTRDLTPQMTYVAATLTCKRLQAAAVAAVMPIPAKAVPVPVPVPAKAVPVPVPAAPVPSPSIPVPVPAPAAAAAVVLAIRTHPQMLANLEATYAALITDGWADWLPNVVAASDLML